MFLGVGFSAAWAQAATNSLTVRTQNAQGGTITGYWTVLQQNGQTVATGFSPATFTLNSGQQYDITVSDYGSATFHHWLDTGSTVRTRTISISVDTTITAVYCISGSPCGSPPAISLNPTSGPVGTVVTVTGSNYPPSSNVAVTYDGTAVTTTPPTVTTNPSGAFSATFAVPSSSPGTHTVSATSGSSSGSAPFTVTGGSFPIIHMQDTTVTYGSLIYTGRQINAEYATSTSQLIGDKIDSITLSLQRIGSPTGTAEIGVFNENLSVKKSFGTMLASSISTSFQDYEFKLSGTDLYTIQSGDRIGIKYNAGNSGNGINVMIDRNTPDPFDGTNSQRIRYESSWLYFDTGEDMYMILKQTQSGSGSDTTPPVITATPAGGTYTSAQSVTLTSNESPTTIYYTTDGSNPTTSPTKITYSGPISIPTTTTLRYYGVDAANNPSAPVTQIYTIVPSGNSPPVANPQSRSVNENADLTITLTGSDPNGDPIKFYIASNPSHGTLSVLNPNTGVVTYSSWDYYDGPDSFRFVVNDGTVDSSEATVSITVANTAQKTTSDAVIISVDEQGHTESGMWTTLSQGGTLLNTGYTHYTHNLNNGQQYVIALEDYFGPLGFVRWQDTSSTQSSRTVSLTDDRGFIVVYREAIVDVSPNQGPVGSTITVSGTGFSSNSPITIRYDGTVQPTQPSTITTSSSGVFSATITVPSSTSGSHEVRATDGNGQTNYDLFVDDGAFSVSDLTVVSQTMSGGAITGLYTTLRQNNVVIASGFTPETYVVHNGEQYVVTVSNYGIYTFDHWLDNGSTSSTRPISVNADTTIIAVYRTS
jgi:chitobiase/beta-hexosaminidase-like protein/Big-like domain-containing protein